MRTFGFLPLLVFQLGAGAHAAPLFSITDLGALPGAKDTDAASLNDFADVVGTSGERAFVWSASKGMRELPASQSGRSYPSSADGINDRGQIVGKAAFSSTESGAVLWNRNGKVDYFLEGTSFDSPNLAYIAKINAVGEVVGESQFGGAGLGGEFVPWLWSSAAGSQTIPDDGLDEHFADDINDRHVITGSIHHGCADRAYVYNVATRRRIWIDKTPDRAHGDDCGWTSKGIAINNVGQVVGYGNVRPYEYPATIKPFIWTAEGEARQLSGSDADPAKRQIAPTDINDVAQVVGTFHYKWRGFHSQFFYWDEASGILDLQDLLDPADPLASDVVLETGDIYAYSYTPSAPKINNKGQIIVSGSLKSEGDTQTGPHRAFLLTPIEP